MSSPTLTHMLEHWNEILDGEGMIELPFNLEEFCRENDQRLAGLAEDLMESSALLSLALRAICYTRDYVEPTLPAIDGWEWYDAGKKIAAAIPDDDWAQEFWKRAQK